MLKFKENKRKQSENKTQKGITLIALVISVIVLLILAGVSISAITGNESAMEKAKQARSKNEQGAEEDAIKLAVVSAMSQNTTTYGMVELANLQNEVKNLDGVSVAEGTGENVGKFIVTGKKGVYTVTKTGIVELLSGVTVSPVSLKLIQGGTGTVSATVSEDLSSEALTWYSTNTEVATVENGTVTVKTGATIGATAEIYAKAGTTESKNRCTVTVVNAMSSVNNLEASGKVGKEITITLPDNTESIASYELLTGASTYVEIKNSKLYGKDVTPSGTTAQVKLIGNSGEETTIGVTITEDIPIIGEPVAATKDKYGYWVERKVFNQDGTVQQENGQDKYEDYPVATATTGGWRLFYQDAENTYIISNNLISSTKPSDNYSSYSGSNLSAAGKGLNYNMISYLTNSSESPNVKGTSYFTDTSVTSSWNIYKGPDADYAIASPTAELFVKSFNTSADVYNVGKTEDEQMKKIGVTVGQYGYEYKMDGLTTNMEQNVLKTKYNKGIYNVDDSSSSTATWWLASPYHAAGSNNYITIVWGKGGMLSNAKDYNSSLLRPLISIPTSTFNSNFRLVDK